MYKLYIFMLCACAVVISLNEVFLPFFRSLSNLA